MSPVRSMTLAFQAFSRLRCCTGVSGWSTMTSSASASSTMLGELLDLAGAEQGRRPRIGDGHDLRMHRRRGRWRGARPTASSRRACGERAVAIGRVGSSSLRRMPGEHRHDDDGAPVDPGALARVRDAGFARSLIAGVVCDVPI